MSTAGPKGRCLCFWGLEGHLSSWLPSGVTLLVLHLKSTTMPISQPHSSAVGHLGGLSLAVSVLWKPWPLSFCGYPAYFPPSPGVGGWLAAPGLFPHPTSCSFSHP